MNNLSKIYLRLVFVVVFSLVFTGCLQKKSDSDSITPPKNRSVSGKLVDPYIEYAVLCQDTNSNNKCDSGEPYSTPTTATGDFTFNEALTPGKRVIVGVKGVHVGKQYDMQLAGIVAADGSIGVISPLTTLMSVGFTSAKIAEILNQAATDSTSDALNNWEIKPSDISKDPLNSGLMDKTMSEIDASELRNLQASLAVYAVLKIMSDPSGPGIPPSQAELEKNETDIKRVFKKFLEIVSGNITEGVLGKITKVSTEKFGKVTLPEPKMGLVVEVAVRIIDALAEAGAKATTNNHVTVAITEIDTMSTKIKDNVREMTLATYGLRNKVAMSSVITNLKGLLTKEENKEENKEATYLLRGVEADSTVATFVFNTEGKVVSHMGIQ